MKEEPLQRGAAGGAGASYAAAGIDVDAANLFVERVKRVAQGASRPEVLAGVGPFSALFALGHYREPVLVSSTDGAGTKIILARILGRFLTIGRDLVNLCINDILTSGAEPLFFLDYIASNGLDDEARLDLVKGMTEACADNSEANTAGAAAARRHRAHHGRRADRQRAPHPAGRTRGPLSGRILATAADL